MRWARSISDTSSESAGWASSHASRARRTADAPAARHRASGGGLAGAEGRPSRMPVPWTASESVLPSPATSPLGASVPCPATPPASALRLPPPLAFHLGVAAPPTRALALALPLVVADAAAVAGPPTSGAERRAEACRVMAVLIRRRRYGPTVWSNTRRPRRAGVGGVPEGWAT